VFKLHPTKLAIRWQSSVFVWVPIVGIKAKSSSLSRLGAGVLSLVPVAASFSDM
jgi:hypothetical protein